MGSHRIIPPGEQEGGWNGPRTYCDSYEEYSSIVRINGRPVCDLCLHSLAAHLPADFSAFIDEPNSEPNPSAESGSEQPTPER
jgi:hypothetical protein